MDKDTTSTDNSPGMSPLGFGLGVIFAVALYYLFSVQLGIDAIVSGVLGGGIGMGLGFLIGQLPLVLRRK